MSRTVRLVSVWAVRHLAGFRRGYISARSVDVTSNGPPVAPSSLAVDLVREANMTLVGFMKDRRFNVCNATQRICDQLGRYQRRL